MYIEKESVFFALLFVVCVVGGFAGAALALWVFA